MIYELYCTVNAIGVPYNDTFRDSPDKSWGVHRWRDVVKDGEHPDSCRGETLLAHEKELRNSGDRVIHVRVVTKEVIAVETLIPLEDLFDEEDQPKIKSQLRSILGE